MAHKVGTACELPIQLARTLVEDIVGSEVAFHPGALSGTLGYVGGIAESLCLVTHITHDEALGIHQIDIGKTYERIVGVRPVLSVGSHSRLALRVDRTIDTTVLLAPAAIGTCNKIGELDSGIAIVESRVVGVLSGESVILLKPQG